MKKNKEFYNIGISEKLIFNLTILTLLSFVGNIIFVIVNRIHQIILFREDYIVIASLIVLLVITFYLVYKVNLGIIYLTLSSLFFLLILTLFHEINPFRIPDNYICIDFKTQNYKYPQRDLNEFCKIDCDFLNDKITKDIKVGKKYYSWRAAVADGKLPEKDNWRSLINSNHKSLFGLFLVLEFTFSNFVEILFIALGLLLFEIFTKNKYNIITEEFISMKKQNSTWHFKKFNIKKINVIGLVLIFIILIYNTYFLYEINTLR